MTLPGGAWSPAGCNPAGHALDGPADDSADESADDIVLTLPAVVEPATIAALCHRLEAILDDPDATGACVDTGALTHPDIAAVDALARLQLAACRRGRRLSLVHMAPELRDLLALAGLDETLGQPERT